MKNIVKPILLFAMAAMVLTSCGDVEPIIYDGPTFVSFTDGTSGSYFVQSDNTPYPVAVGIPAAASADVTIDIEVLYASGTAGTHYDIPSSVTISKGEVTADIVVNGYFDEMPGRVDTLQFQLVGSERAAFDTAFTLIMQQFCPFDVNDFVTFPFDCKKVCQSRRLVSVDYFEMFDSRLR